VQSYLREHIFIVILYVNGFRGPAALDWFYNMQYMLTFNQGS